MTTDEAIETIKQARSTLTKIKDGRKGLPTHSDKPLSKSTVKTYTDEIKSLVNKCGRMNKSVNFNSIVLVAKETQSIRTWHKRRAAMLYYFINLMEINLNIQNEMQRTHRGSDEWLVIVAKIKRITGILAKIENEPPIHLKDRKPKKSKMRELRDLPNDWREIVIARMPSYQPQILTLAITGCRPCEIVKGIEWSIIDGMLIAEIKGAKLGKHSGQEIRVLAYKINSPLVKSLAKIIIENGGACTIVLKSAANLTHSIRTAARRAFPKLKKSITCYSFRHQCAADLKANALLSGNSDEAQLQISAALGHAASQTKGQYGQAKQTRSGGAIPVKVTATRIVKQKVKTDFTNIKTIVPKPKI
jgi:integrase